MAELSGRSRVGGTGGAGGREQGEMVQMLIATGRQARQWRRVNEASAWPVPLALQPEACLRHPLASTQPASARPNQPDPDTSPTRTLHVAATSSSPPPLLLVPAPVPHAATQHPRLTSPLLSCPVPPCPRHHGRARTRMTGGAPRTPRSARQLGSAAPLISTRFNFQL
ncbi:hypothetical protein NDU88_002445 [Pleurodeles waltl]|uniref:Uncharacterized protein n=1 Tax=Pleurodeles waltl TaxID=8319 RepID=A0AAV7TKN5_PLEWA|nr:hypothetical protein NDU88_002445 [Pleurodeles waltl]